MKFILKEGLLRLSENDNKSFAVCACCAYESESRGELAIWALTQFQRPTTFSRTIRDV